MTAIDLHASVLLVALLVSLAASYAVRVALEGPARFDRVKEAGASPLLGASAMEMGYWGLQPLARACVAAGVSADRVTHASLALGAAAGVAVAGGHLGVGAALATAAAVGDAVDGLVARSTATATRRGAILDAAADRYAEAFFLAGLALHYHADQAKLGMVLAALVGSFMVSYGSAKADALGTRAPRGAMRRAERATFLAAGAGLSPLAWAAAEGGQLASWAAELPMLAALAVVGGVANVSAVRRLVAIAHAAGDAPPTRDAHAPPSTSSPPAAGLPSDPALDDAFARLAPR